MAKALSMSARIKQVLAEPRWSDEDKAIIVDRIKRRWWWIDLMSNLDITLTPEERRAWAEDIEAYKNSMPSAFLQRMSSWKTPDDRTMLYRWNTIKSGVVPTGILADGSSMRRFESWGDRDHASHFVKYLRLLHNYLEQVEAPKQAFNGIPNQLYQTEGWYRSALMNGALLYRKLLEAGAIEYGTKLNLWESFSRTDLMGLVGLKENGKEMSAPQHARFIKSLVQSYVTNGGKKPNQDEPLPKDEPEVVYAATDKANQPVEAAQVETESKTEPRRNLWQSIKASVKDYFSDTEDDLDPELAAVIQEKAQAMRAVEEERKTWPWARRFTTALSDNFAFWRKSEFDKIDEKYDAKYAEIAERKFPETHTSLWDTLRNWRHKPQKQEQPENPVSETQSVATEETTQPVVAKTVTKRQRKPRPRKVLNDWRAAPAVAPKATAPANQPISKTGCENGNTVTKLFYPKLNKVVRITEHRNGLKEITTIYIERKRDGISGKAATYYERTLANGQVQHLASLTGNMTYGRAGIYVGSHDKIAKKVSYLSIRELEYWKREMTKVKIAEHKRKVENRIKFAHTKATTMHVMAQANMAQAS